MADLISPGVQVSINDQSQYLPSAANSVPFVLIATQQDKANPNGTGIAPGTTTANAGKLYRITSQRDLVSTFGKPYFQKDSAGNPIQGGQLNEYGLLAAYYALGATNSCYVLRANIDTSQLVGSVGRPTGNPADGTWWQDTTNSTWGIYEWNATTQTFVLQEPLVILDEANLDGDMPLQSLGNIGDYAVTIVTTEAGEPIQGPQTYAPPWETNSWQFFHKNDQNEWVAIGSTQWLATVPTVTGTANGAVVLSAGSFTIGFSTLNSVTITVGAGDTTSDVAGYINALGWEGLSADTDSVGHLRLYDKTIPHYNQNKIVLGPNPSTTLTELGLAPGNYYQPHFQYGSSAQQPLWQAQQSYPHPTGSVWIKVGSQGNGLVTSLSRYDATQEAWIEKKVSPYLSDWAAIAATDSSGGKAIPANTVYAQYNFNSSVSNDSDGPVYLWKRLATGPTVVVGTETNPVFENGTYEISAGPPAVYGYWFQVYVSAPGNATLLGSYTCILENGGGAAEFVTAWQAANIPYTTATVTSSGAIQLTHTEGGVIVINDTADGYPSDLLSSAGIIPNQTQCVKYGSPAGRLWTGVTQSSTSGSGAGAVINALPNNVTYSITVTGGGSGYAIGDTVTFSGADLGGTTPTNDLVIYVTNVDGGGAITGSVIKSGTSTTLWYTELSNWVGFTYTANEAAPVSDPANNTYWYYTAVNQADIMVKYQNGWKGYKNQGYDANGFPSPTIPNSGATATDPNGPIISTTAPTTQSTGDDLVYGDLWIDTSDLNNYPQISRWQSVDGTDQWVLIDNTDHVTSSGIYFADARWATNGTTDPANDPMPTIVSLLSSDYLDLDAPDPDLYPNGTLLFNTRRSGYNVKAWKNNYLSSANFPGQGPYPAQKSTWVSQSGNNLEGVPYMGSAAQRAIVVASLKSAIDNNEAVRDEDNYFNLMACPNYIELAPNMIAVNAERDYTAYVLADTPMTLPNNATDIAAWASSSAVYSQYMALFYPSGLTNDLDGNAVAVPATHMMLRTFLRNDSIAYPWLAAAGVRRGQIDNAIAIGYVDETSGNFISIKPNMGIRDTLYENNINPLVFFTGNGLLNFGNKSRFAQAGSLSGSALDRTNVARLVAYIRRQLTILARPFIFEPNDAVTRKSIAGVVQSLMLDLMAKRGIYDYLVVCDTSNNTPETIDRNELWVDVAIEPVKAAEFVYIPVRILNTGELGGQTGATAQGVSRGGV